MANIKLNNNSYSIPDSTLAAPKANFIAHLGTITGNGLKVVVGGVEYGIDAAKVAGAVAEIEAVLADICEERLEGDGQEFYTMAPSTLTFRSTAPLNELQDVQINGVTVDPANYTLEEGSTIVKLHYDYLGTLNVGKYELSVVSDSKTVKGDFTVAAPILNEYGFYYNQPYYVDFAEFEIGSGFMSLRGNYCFVLHEDGTASFVDIIATDHNKATISCENDVYTIGFVGAEFTGTFSADDRSFIGTTTTYMGKTYEGVKFTISHDYVAADSEYFYLRDDISSPWGVCPIYSMYYQDFDNTKTSYGPVKSNINGDPVTHFNMEGFYNHHSVTSVHIPSSFTELSTANFWNCTSLMSINFEGTLEQWEAINKQEGWNNSCGEITVTCTDGTVIIPASNS